MRFKNKADFVETSGAEWERFMDLVSELSPADLIKPGVWGKGWNVKDMLAHIHEWHLMVLSWHKEGQKGPISIPAPGYRWSETPRLNEAIYQKYKGLSAAEAVKKVKASHAKTMKLIGSLSERQLLEPGQFEWCGKNAISTYLAGAAISHYRWGQKKLKKWAKNR